MGLLERIGHDGTCLQRVHRRVLHQTGTDGFLMDGIELKLDVVAISTVALQALRRGPAN